MFIFKSKNFEQRNHFCRLLPYFTMAASSGKLKSARNCSLTLYDKLEIIKAVESGQHKRSYIARQFGISKSSISDVIKKKQKIVEAFEVSNISPNRKRLRTSTYADVEEAILLWLKQARALKIPITGPAIQDKGRELARSLGHPGFVCSKGWLHRFKARNGILFQGSQGSQGGANEPTTPVNSVLNGVQNGVQNGTNAEDWESEKLPKLLVEYCPQNIFSAGEIRFYWKALPDFTVKATGEVYCNGIGSDEHCTVLICTNMTGEEKLPLLVIGRNSEPRVFANVRTLPVLYEANEKAAMVDDIFTSWLVLIDKKFQQEGRKIAMIVSEDVPHSPFVQVQLKAVKLFFFPSQATSRHHQPCQQGITRSVKMSYRKYLLTKLIAAIEVGERFHLDLLDALHLLHLSWVNVSQDTIKSSFFCSGFKPRDVVSSAAGTSTETAEPASPDFSGGEALLKHLRTVGANLTESLSFEQYVDVDSKVSTAASGDVTTSVPQGKRPLHNLVANGENLGMPLPPPSTNEAEKAVKVLRRYFETRSNMEQALNLVAEVEKRVLDCSIQPR